LERWPLFDSASLAFGIFRVWIGAGSETAAIAFVVLCHYRFLPSPVRTGDHDFRWFWEIISAHGYGHRGLFLNLTLSPLLAAALGFRVFWWEQLLLMRGASLVFVFWTLSMQEFTMPIGQLSVQIAPLPILAAANAWCGSHSVLAALVKEFRSANSLFGLQLLPVSIFVALSLTQDVHRSTVRRTFWLRPRTILGPAEADRRRNHQ